MDSPKECARFGRYMVMPMKTSLATTISVVGVVAAGALTFAVNSTTLTSAATTGNLPSVDAAALMQERTGLTVLTPPAVIALTDVVTQSVGSDRSAVTSSSSIPQSQINSPTTTVQVGQARISSYSIQGAASVQLVQSASHLSVNGVTPQDGFIYSAENVSATRVVVTLSNSSQRLKFNAEIIGGRVVTSLIASDVIAPAVTTAPANATSPTITAPRRARDAQKDGKNSKKESQNNRDDDDDDDDDDDKRDKRDKRRDDDDD
jgi:hypothetical protein